MADNNDDPYSALSAKIDSTLAAADKTGTDPYGALASAVADSDEPINQYGNTDQTNPSMGGGRLTVLNPFGNAINRGENFDTGINTSQNVDRFLSGAGKAPYDTGLGLEEAAAQARFKMGGPQTPLINLQNQIVQTREQDAPLMHTGMGQFGNMMGQGAETIAIPGGVWGQAAAQGALGGMQPTLGNESRGVNAGLSFTGGLIGGAVGKSAGGLLPTNYLRGPVQDAVDELDKRGVVMGTSRQTGSPTMNNIRNFVGDMGYHGSDDTQRSFTRAASHTFGENTDVLDQKTLDSAAQRIGGVKNDIADRTPIDLTKPVTFTDRETGVTTTKPFLDHLTDLETEANSDLDNPKAIVSKINRLQDSAASNGGGNIVDGRDFKKVWSATGRLAKKADPDMRLTGGKLGDLMDAAMESQAAPADYTALQQANSQWRNLQLVGDSVVKNPERQVTPAALWSQVSAKSNKRSVLFGNGDQDLHDLASAGKTALSDIGNSGTAPRLIGAGMVGGGIEAARDAFGGDFSTALKLGLLGAAAPKVGNFLENSNIARTAIPFIARSGVPAAVKRTATAMGAGAGADIFRPKKQDQDQ